MKIGLCSTMSCGKTTLTKSLALLPEFKDYEISTERSKYLSNLGIPLNTDSTINGQMIFMAERATELLQENIITDRTIIDVMAFTKSAKSINVKNKPLFNKLAVTLIPQYDWIFYISPKGIKIEDNGVRETDPKYRKLIDNNIKYILNKNGYLIQNLAEISGTNEERIQQIKHYIGI